MLQPPAKVMPGELACKRTYTEHGYDRKQLQHGAHDLAGAYKSDIGEGAA